MPLAAVCHIQLLTRDAAPWAQVVALKQGGAFAEQCVVPAAAAWKVPGKPPCTYTCLGSTRCGRCLGKSVRHVDNGAPAQRAAVLCAQPSLLML